MNKYYARIKDNIVKDVIVLADLSLMSLFSQGYDFVIEIKNEPGDPGIGWSYTPEDGFKSPEK